MFAVSQQLLLRQLSLHQHPARCSQSNKVNFASLRSMPTERICMSMILLRTATLSPTPAEGHNGGPSR